MPRPNFVRAILPAILFATACSGVDQISAPVAAPPSHGVIQVGSSGNLTQSVPGAVPSPAGLKACFAGEANAKDVVSSNTGALSGATSYTAGRFGQAFDFTTINDGVTIPTSATLNVGAGAGITMSAWIYPRGQSFGGAYGAGPVMEYEGGAHMWQHEQTGGANGLFVNFAEGTAASQYHILQVNDVVPWTTWTHIAATYSKATGQITLYRNVPSLRPRVARSVRLLQRHCALAGASCSSSAIRNTRSTVPSTKCSSTTVA